MGTDTRLPKQLCVAVVADNEPMRGVIIEMLRSFGLASFVVASNGIDALRKMAAHHPHVIVADCLMQPMSGVTMTQMIRRSEAKLNPHTPIVMITGHGEYDTVAMARDAGASEVLAKPITGNALLARIKASIEKPRPFVRGGDFYGPDRRRRNLGPFGAERRRLQPIIEYQPQSAERASHMR